MFQLVWYVYYYSTLKTRMPRRHSNSSMAFLALLLSVKNTLVLFYMATLSLLKLQLGEQFPLEDVPVINDLVIMIMTKEPVGKLAPLATFQEIGQLIRPIGRINLSDDMTGSAVGQDVIYLPVDSFQIALSFAYSWSFGISSCHP